MENYNIGGLYGTYKDISTISSFKFMDFENKESLHRYHMLNMLNKTQSMFDWELPENTGMTRRTLELQMQFHGYTIIFEHKGKIYSSWGGLGGMPDQNYMPTLAIVANPYLKMSKTFVIDKECVVIPNDKLYLGVMPTNQYYASQMVENDISLNTLLINARAMNILVASDSDVKESLDELLNDLKNGKLKSILDKNIMTNNVLSVPFASSNTSQTIIQLLEERQYIKGSWLNELGIQSNYNMKREAITSNENILNVDNLLPMTDNMYECRQEGIRKVKELFGIEMKCDFSSSWKKLRTEIRLKEDAISEEENSSQLEKKGDINDENND